MPEPFIVDGREFVLNIPSASSPGYMRRMEKYAELGEAMKGAFNASALRAFLELLANYVQPADGGDPMEALRDLSEDGLNMVQEAIKGGGETPKAETPSPS